MTPEALRRALASLIARWPHEYQEEALAHVRAALAALEGKFDKGGRRA